MSRPSARQPALETYFGHEEPVLDTVFHPTTGWRLFPPGRRRVTAYLVRVLIREGYTRIGVTTSGAGRGVAEFELRNLNRGDDR